MNSNSKKPPVAPAVYRPQPTPRVLQRKTAIPSPPSTQPHIARSQSHPVRQRNPNITFRQQPTPKPVARVPHNANRPVIQRMRDPRVEAEKAKMQQRAQKKTNMAQFAQGHGHLYRAAPNWAEQRMVSGLAFGGNRSSASLITSDISDTVYVAEQSGQAAKHPDDVWNLSGAETIACDEYHDRGLHAEMQIIYSLLEDWKGSGDGYGYGSAEAFLRARIGGGKAVAKGKGCCRLCAAILLKLGVNVGYIENSKYESIWVDPFEVAEIPNPWF